MKNGYNEIVRFFNKAGTIPGTLGESILTSNIRLAERFIAYGSEIDEKGVQGKTPLIIAFDSNDYDMAAFLISKGANIHVQPII